MTFTVGLVDSHDSVDMENLTIVYADAIRTETLHPVEGYHGDPPKGFWGIIRVENEVGSPNNRLDNEERFVIRINPTAPLVPRQMITIDVKPPAGRSLAIRRVAPHPSLLKIFCPPCNLQSIRETKDPGSCGDTVAEDIKTRILAL